MTASLEAMLREAARLRQSGAWADAERAYQRLLAAAPDLSDSWYNLGFVQQRLGRWEAALASYQQALDRKVAQPEEVHLNRAVIYADHLRRADEAEAELAAALRCNPAYVPALLNLGNLHEDRGRRAGAAGAYEQALAFDPRCWQALARLAGLTPGADDLIIQRLREALERADVPAADKANLGFALGGALDARAAYDGAFAAYTGANASSRACAQGKGAYDRRAHEQLIEDVAAAFATADPVATAPAAKAPIFICGMFRSGSTLAEQVLAAHPRVTAGGELAFIPSLARTELAPFPASIAAIAPAAFDGYAARYLEEVDRLFAGADRVTDKRPDNYLYIGLIKRLLPRAKIVHTTRNPLDNCLSIYFLHLDHSMSYALDLGDIGHYYRCYRRLMAHWRALYGADILDFDYDAFVREPRSELARLLAFCDLEWDEGCLSFHRADSVVKTASVWQVREPLYQSSSGRWRHYQRWLAPLRAALDGPDA